MHKYTLFIHLYLYIYIHLYIYIYIVMSWRQSNAPTLLIIAMALWWHAGYGQPVAEFVYIYIWVSIYECKTNKKISNFSTQRLLKNSLPSGQKFPAIEANEILKRKFSKNLFYSFRLRLNFIAKNAGYLLIF